MSGLQSPSCRLGLAALAGCLLIGAFGPAAPSAVAAPTTMVDLGDASTYAVLSGASIGNTVSAPGAPHTRLRGDLGVKANTQPTGFPPGVVTGAVHIGDAAAAQAHADLVAAYNDVAARTGGDALAGALAGATVLPGLHTIAGAVSNTGTVTLDAGGNPNAVFVFQVNGAMAMAAGSHVVLTGGAQASRVFWQVNGAGAVGANADFAGTLMALDAVAVGNGSLVNGRAFARNGALTLDANEFYSAPPVVTITGGAGDITTDTTPTISGTTNVEAPALVTVTINGQTLTATPSGGAWSVTSAILANATYPVVGLRHGRGRKPGERHPAADRRHGAARRHHRRRAVPDDERPDPDARRHQRRRGRHCRPRERGLAGPHRARAGRGDVERDPDRADRRHPHRHRLRLRSRRQRGHRQPGADRRHHRTPGDDRRWGHCADQRCDTGHLRDGGRRARHDRDRGPRGRDADGAGLRRRGVVRDRCCPLRRPASRHHVGLRRGRQRRPASPRC